MKTFTFIFDADYGIEELWTAQVIAEDLETAKQEVLEQEQKAYNEAHGVYFDFDEQISRVISIDHETNLQQKY